MKILTIVSEVSIVLILAVLLNMLVMPTNLGFFSVSPHPYWAAVLLFSLRYKILYSLISGATLAVLYMGLFYISPQFTDFDGMLTFNTLALPISFIVISLVISMNTERHEERSLDLKLKNQHSADRIDSLNKTIKFQEDLNKELERKLVNNTNTIAKVFEIAKCLESDKEDIILSNILNELSFHLNIKESVGYIINEENLKIAGKIGLTPVEESLPIGYADELLQRAFNEKKTVWHKSLDQGKKGNVPFLCAVPIICSDNTVAGLIGIIDIPFISFNRETLTFLDVVCEWTGRKFSDLKQKKQAREKDIYDTESDMYTFTYLKKIFDVELYNYSKYKKIFSIVLIRFHCEETMNLKVVQLILHDLIATDIRKTDVITKYKTEEEFLVFLPHTSYDNASVFADRIYHRINEFYNEEEQMLQYSFSTVTISENHQTLDDFLLEAENAVEVFT